VQHTLGTIWTTARNYETFVSTELLNICRRIFRSRKTPPKTWIGGIGTGGYGAFNRVDHPDVFSKAFASMARWI
jgi:S-formylglutathione hydrolase FrmB